MELYTVINALQYTGCQLPMCEGKLFQQMEGSFVGKGVLLNHIRLFLKKLRVNRFGY